MKKFRMLAVLLAILMVLNLAACAAGQETPPSSGLEDTETTAPAEEPVTTEPETEEVTVTTAETRETETEEEILDPATHPHTFVGLSCTEKGTCKCGAVSEPLGHSFTGGSCTSAATCSRCRAKGDVLPHTFVGGSCTSAATCSRCGAAGAVLGHQFTGATCAAPSTCTRCGLTEGAALGHSYSGGKCVRCGDTNGPLQPWEAGLFRNKLSDEQNAQALAIARSLAAQANAVGGSDLDKIGRAAQLVSNEYYKGVHKESGIYYSEAYGVFVARESSCAGCSRALGLVLTCMGYSWTHVNANQWTHQWVTVNVNGETIWADGQVGWCGTGQHPMA